MEDDGCDNLKQLEDILSKIEQSSCEDIKYLAQEGSKLLHRISTRHVQDQLLLKAVNEEELSKSGSWVETVTDVFGSKSKWEYVGNGQYGKVYKGVYKGTQVAVKVLSEEGARKVQIEAKILRRLDHNNIVAFKAMGRIPQEVCEDIRDGRVSRWRIPADSFCIIMDYIQENLAKYVARQESDDRQGLGLQMTWDLGSQIVHALHYLHGLKQPIAHRDLKPDNILLDIRVMPPQVKLADFGQACHGYSCTDTKQSVDEKRSMHARWAAPEQEESMMTGSSSSAYYTGSGESSSTFQGSSGSCGSSLSNTSYGASGTDQADTINHDIDCYKKADIYSLGLVFAFMVSGGKPLKTIVSHDLGQHQPDYRKEKRRQWLDSVCQFQKEPLTGLIRRCCTEDPVLRPTIQELVDTDEYQEFSSESNPFQSEQLVAEFFSCGFLRDTKIFVADSLTDESFQGYYNTHQPAQGYNRNFTSGPVQPPPDPNHNPEDTPSSYKNLDGELQEQYNKNKAHFKGLAKAKTIDDNPILALKELVIDRAGTEEEQYVGLRFEETSYCHHRSIREIWRHLTEDEQNYLVPTKQKVHPIFSTSFGLHVAILTNDTPQKFIFMKRSKKEGMASPGAITCGAVESCSVLKDCFYRDDQKFVSLHKTAARGLSEEIRIEVEEDEYDAICLSTFYLKFDNHEWGLGGFLDLKHPALSQEHQLSFKQVEDHFTTGPKDKFEHESLIGINFELEPMARFVRDYYQDFASSAKLVVVKVMQAYFGVSEVERMFHLYDKPQE